MTDEAARRHQRNPADLARAQARMLRERVRAGTLRRIARDPGTWPLCRDCADDSENGWCPYSDSPCDGPTLRPAQDTLELLACCGHAGARVLAPRVPEGLCGFYLQGKGPPGDWEVLDALTCFSDWIAGLERWGRGVMVRAACTVADHSFEEWLDQPCLLPCSLRVVGRPHPRRAHPESGGAIRRAIDACRAWADDPNEDNRLSCERLVGEVSPNWLPAPAWHSLRGIANGFRHGLRDLAGSLSRGRGEAIRKDLVRWALA